MSHTELALIYHGPAVESGAMDVRDLAPALLAIGNLIEAANRVVNGDNAATKVQVRNVAPGSFSIGLDVSVAFLQTIRDILAGPEATAAANLIAILTPAAAGAIGVVKLLKWLKGRNPTAAKRKDSGRVEIEIDGLTIEVDEIVAKVAVDVSVRLAFERVVAEPLSKDGIDSVEIGSKDHPEKIEKSEGYSFLAPPDREVGTFEHRFRAPFSIISLSFKEGNKWRLHDGKTALSVTVVDEAFLAKVNRNEVAFSKGDILICDVRVLTRQDQKGLKAEHFIERVIEHRRPSQQPSLFEREKFGPSGGRDRPSAGSIT